MVGRYRGRLVKQAQGQPIAKIPAKIAGEEGKTGRVDVTSPPDREPMRDRYEVLSRLSYDCCVMLTPFGDQRWRRHRSYRTWRGQAVQIRSCVLCGAAIAPGKLVYAPPVNLKNSCQRAHDVCVERRGCFG